MKKQLKEIKTCPYLLFESADANNVSAAITGMHPAFITYDDEQGGGGKNRRYIYPVAYGVSRAGNPVVRAFQPQGSTKRGVPHWKLFRLDRVKSWRTLSNKTFDPDTLIGYNKDGDDHMETLYAILPIGNAANIRIKNEPIQLKATPITKKDIEMEPDVDAKQDAEKEKVAKEKVSAKDIVNNIVGRIKTGAKNIWDRIRGKKTQQDTAQTTEPKDNVDNGEEKSYNNDEWQKYKMTAQDENPIYKSEIPGGDNAVDVTNTGATQPVTEPSNADNNISDEPITKDDINGTPDNIDDDEDYAEDDADELAKAQLEEIKSLMHRMDMLTENNKKYLNLNLL